MSDRPILIIGAGPTGLAAAIRLDELDVRAVVVEAADHVGGLTSSWTDEQGFTWDHGGHVMFSRDARANALVDRALDGEWTTHRRHAAVRIDDRWVPYPFQHNVHRLDDAGYDACIGGIDARPPTTSAVDFETWIGDVFGAGIAARFMLPYNRKVWSHPLGEMGVQWQGDRVPDVDAARVRRNRAAGTDDDAWGPNESFRFPTRGTGLLCDRLAGMLPVAPRLSSPVAAVDVGGRRATLADGTTIDWSAVVSTMPLDRLVGIVPDAPPEVRAAAAELVHNSGAFVGLGVRGATPTDRSWMYFPGDEPFYRVTVLSNYSTAVRPAGCFSLLAECSFPAGASVPADLVERTIEGLVRCGLLTEAQVDHEIVSRQVRTAEHLYPVPTIGRDRALRVIEPWLAAHGVLSRGRFGAWRYELGNTDHALMMGLEAVDRLVDGLAETVWC